MTAIAQALMSEETVVDEPAADGVEDLRAGIDEIDRALMELLADRCRLARALGRTKRAGDLPMEDPAREADVVRRAGAAARRSGLDEELVRSLFWSVIELSRRTQREDA